MFAFHEQRTPAVVSEPPPPRRNIELKARCRDLAAARRLARQLATSYVGVEHQVDTYFRVAHGRLKLREINGQQAQLVWYDRPDTSDFKRSDYRLIPVDNGSDLKAALSAALGVRGVVDKQRAIFLVDNVRVHLDEVSGLGSFLEFEAVLRPDQHDAVGHRQLDELSRRLGIGKGDLLAESYVDLVKSYT